MKWFNNVGLIGLLLSLTLTVSGCDFLWDVLGPPEDEEEATEFDISGRWAGATGPVRIEGIPSPERYLLLAFDGVFEIGSVPLTLELTQNEPDQVSGVVRATAVVSVNTSVDGFMLGNQLSLEGKVQFLPKTPTYDVQFTGVVDDNRIQGGWSVIEAGALVKSGDWHARR